MFTGIVEELGSVESLIGPRLRIRASRVLDDVTMGASTAVNGVCLTVVDKGEHSFGVDVSPETLRLDLVDLVDRGILLKIGSKKGTYYILK